MFKHLLFTSFLALLATSCGGGHITTTPVVKNAPSASLSTPTKKNLTPPTGYNSTLPISLSLTSTGNWQFYTMDGQTASVGNLQNGAPYFQYYASYLYLVIATSASDYRAISVLDYLRITDTNGSSSTWAIIGPSNPSPENPFYVEGYFNFVPRDAGYENGYSTGYDEGIENGYVIGYQEGEAYNNPIIQNGQYAGLTAFPRRHYLEILGRRVVSGLEHLQDGYFDLIDTNANYTIYIKWSYSYPKTTFKDYGNDIIGELYWTDIIQGNWSTSWFGKYDAELHHISPSPKYYATDAPIAMSFYPEVYLGSTIQGDVDLFFMGTANDYALGFADGQTYTIQASETYNNIFTIFTPAFRAVANFFNLNIGPFKIWYFFAIPLIVTLLILVLRLVKH